jgi:prepilin-type N-terminal cleavage/methylation domain-containing protein
MSAHSTNKEGFTIIEAMIAMLIIAVAFAGSISMMLGMLRANAFSARTTTAVSLAQEVVDDAMDTDYALVTAGSDTVDLFSRTWTVTRSGSVKTINVNVTWPGIDKAGSAHQVTLSGMLDED